MTVNSKRARAHTRIYTVFEIITKMLKDVGIRVKKWKKKREGMMAL